LTEEPVRVLGLFQKDKGGKRSRHAEKAERLERIPNSEMDGCGRFFQELFLNKAKNANGYQAAVK